MNIRVKLFIFILIFVVIVSFFGAGSVYVMNRITDSLDLLRSTTEADKLQKELKRSILQYANNIKDWVFTEDKKYLRDYDRSLAEVYKAFGNLRDYPVEKERLDEIGKKFQELKSIAEDILTYEKPTGNVDVFFLINDFDDKEMEVLSKIEEIGTRSLRRLNSVIAEAENIKAKITVYISIILVFTIFSVIFLGLIITQSIDKPFKELISITEKISGDAMEDLSSFRRTDEFGVLAEHFSRVLERLKESEKELKRRLKEREILYEITKVASSTLQMENSIYLIAQSIADKFGVDHVAIYLLSPERNRLTLKATNRSHDVFRENIPVGDADICSKISKTHETVQMRGDEAEGSQFTTKPMGTVVVVPIVKDEQCAGVLVVANKEERYFEEHELHLFDIISHTISTVLSNIELYSSTINQLHKITLFYNLSSTLTTVLDLQALLEKVAREVTHLINATGCIIRLKEGDELVIKAYYGVPAETIEGMNLKVGEGIAGKVAQFGNPLLVEDVTAMPKDTRVPILPVKTVVCVPLKLGESIIGTLGLYDKKTPEGEITTFSHEDLLTTEGFASIIALAIEKARLFELQVKKEKEAREAKKRLDILFDSVQSGIVTLDRDYRILSVNRYVEEFLGMKMDELVGYSAVELLHEKGGFCPHCVAKLTFETGDINVITQNKGANYAELSSYPVKDESGEVTEAVVLIQDITDRVLYQEEILSLYKEVAQTKDYLESIIENSADAIITTDLEGIVTSWNKGAERIYGFTEEEAKGKFLPFVPDFLYETERQYIERIKKGETIKDIETVRKTKDGRIIEVSLTLSPIKDATGEIIGISGISRDISEKKKVEKELIRRNQELSRLFFISSAMRGTLELERLLRMVLTAVTMSDGLGFNRAILFLMDENRKTLRGVMGVGPASPDEAWQVWEQLSLEKKTLPEILREIETGPLRKDSFLDRLSTGIEIDIDSNTAMSVAARERKGIIVSDAKKDPLSDPIIIQQLGSDAYAVVPLIARDKVIGAIWVDNYFNRKPITEEDMRFLSGFADQVASAIESARLFEKVKLAEAELENIFQSITDLLYITTEDYTIRNVNKAVTDVLGKPRNEIIGKKCYEVFHGMDRPYEKCPHHKTVQNKKAYIEEFEDPYRKGTFLTSTSPLFDTSGNFMGTVHVVRDVTELKKLREKLALSERMAALGEVAAKVAHEIRNPLVSIGGFSRRLEKKLDGQYKEYASIITREVNRLEHILRDILGFVKEVRLSKELSDARKIIEETISLFTREIDKKGIEIVTEYKDPLPVEIDHNRMKEALINIINNAVQVLPEGGRITIRTYREGKEGVIEISDTGPGISEKDLPFIFDPFFTTKIEGTGLGLAITHRIVEEHGGRIEVKSVQGEGTTFYIHLPIAEGVGYG